MPAEKSSSKLLVLIARLFIGLVFAYSGFTKLVEPVENFQAAVAAYEVIPSFAIPWIARIIPWIEFIFGIFTIIGYMTRISAAILAAMSWGFVLLISVTWLATHALPADCGCFGEGSLIHLAPYQVLLLDLVNTVIGLCLFLGKDPAFSLDAVIQSKT